ncbi:Clp protease N-terminal domain-containing protein [Nakamurella multipartita]|uniref:Clp protease N-terminal domain-containing protein n=1 Tax=Nakamurella multipartita TaxID=53461 RepID=UPI0009FF19D9|nr:Clp protease N-terminal domain-containing protein [Nakamurella multipartita]
MPLRELCETVWEAMSAELTNSEVMRQLVAESRDELSAESEALSNDLDESQPDDDRSISDRFAFDRFTQPARFVIVVAQEEARSIGHNYIGAEHLFLGVLYQAQELNGELGSLLNGFGVFLDTSRKLLIKFVGRGRYHEQGHLAFAPHAKKALAVAYTRAMKRKADVEVSDILAGVVSIDGFWSRIVGCQVDPAQVFRFAMVNCSVEYLQVVEGK